MTGSPVSIWGLSTAEMDGVFSADRIVSAILRFEAALALALADAGIAPRTEAEAVAEACEVQVGDAEGLLATTWETGTPIVAIKELVEARLSSDDERRWVHHGSTTQDALDTAYMLLVRDALEILESGLIELAGLLRKLAIDHREQPHMGRTLLQDALATTFGLRVAGWLDPILTHLETLRSCRATLTVQLGGPVGDLGAYGGNGASVSTALAGRLGLQPAGFPWHSDRTRIRVVVNAVDDAVASLAKMAIDVSLLAQSAVAEVSARAGASSSMSHKRNPIDAVRALAAADVCRGSADIVRHARPHELDRSLGSWQAEWVALPLLFASSDAAVESAIALARALEVDGSAMSAAAGDEPLPDTSLVGFVVDRCDRLLDEV